MDLRRHFPPPLLWAPLFGLAALALAAITGGLSTSFLDPDESAHYVNTLFLADWMRAGLPSPMPFARDFYAHFPRLTIGHWPPGWYALWAPVFAVARLSPQGATLLSAFLAGLPALLVLWGVDRVGHRRIGIVAALAYLLIPLVAEEARYFRLDQPVSLVVGLATMAWMAASERPSLLRYLLFGALAAFATLVKGNGALIMLVPALEILFDRRWPQLADWRLWVAAAATLLVVAPWYYVSFRISAGGFNYAPGPTYAWLSLSENMRAIAGAVGWPGLAIALAGAVVGWRDPVTRLSVAAILATLIFQAAIPVALEDRYALPAIPWLVVLIAIALLALARRGAAMRGAAVAVAVALMIAPIWALVHKEPKRDMGAPAIAAAMAAKPGIWLVDGRAGGEGAIIAAAAYADGGRRQVWAARASQWLSTSDFMGRGYRLSVADAAGARRVLDRLGARGVVSIADRQALAYPHSRLLREALQILGFRIDQRRFARGDGSVLLGVRTGPVTPHPDLLADGSGSKNAATLGATF